MKNFASVIFAICLGLSCVSIAQDKPVKNNNNKKKQTLDAVQKKAFAIGAETRYYRYSEPGFVSHTGILSGVWGEWYWQGPLGKGKLYGNLLYGGLDYDGGLCDMSGNCTPYSAKTTDWIWKLNSRLEINLTESLNLFAGVGYRYLNDLGQGTGFYTRIGNWAYLPLGGYFKYQRFSLELEYDLIVYGNFKSNLSEVSSLFSDISHTQKGYGLLLTAGYQLSSAWSLQMIYESWNLDESDVVSSGGSYFVEPKNDSQSTGLRVGYQF